MIIETSCDLNCEGFRRSNSFTLLLISNLPQLVLTRNVRGYGTLRSLLIR